MSRDSTGVDPYGHCQHGVAHQPGQFVSPVLYDDVYQDSHQ
jgi:hypothetical protein